WLVWPSFLPLTDLEDAVAHLMLIEWLTAYQHLPHDPALGPYLGGLADYPPGFHSVVALAAGWLAVPAVRLLHPVVSLFVALKAGLEYLIVARLVGGRRGLGAGV